MQVQISCPGGGINPSTLLVAYQELRESLEAEEMQFVGYEYILEIIYNAIIRTNLV